MCLPFCCRENDNPPQPQGTHDHPTHGVSHTEPVDDHLPSTGPGKEGTAKNGKNGEVKNRMEGSPPTPAPKSIDTAEVPLPTRAAPPRAPPSPNKHGGQKTEEDASVAARRRPPDEHIFRELFPTAATKAPKKVEQVVAGPKSHHAGPVLVAEGVADSARTPPETQQIHRGHEAEDYGYPNPSASPIVVAAVPAANNFRGDRGHGDAHAHADGGKDDRKTAGRTRW